MMNENGIRNDSSVGKVTVVIAAVRYSRSFKTKKTGIATNKVLVLWKPPSGSLAIENFRRR